MQHWIEPRFAQGLDRVNELIQASKNPKMERNEYLQLTRLFLSVYHEVWGGCELGHALRNKPDRDEVDLPAEFEQSDGLQGPNKAWTWAHQDNERTDWYQTWKADLAEWCSSIWDDQRLEEWGRLNGEWSIENFQNWAPLKQEQNILERQRRMINSPNRPKRIPCKHGLNQNEMPQRTGLLYYRGRFDRGDHEFSSCPLCFEEMGSVARATKKPQVKIVRFGGAR